MDITVTFIVAALIATAVPLMALYIIYSLDLYGTGSFKLILGSFVWGIVAFGLAFGLNHLTIDRELLPSIIVKQFSAPISEEIFKGLILIYLVRRADFTYFVDGAIYGFAIGIGFAIVEDYSYVAGNTSAAVGVATSRVISTNLIHAAASGVVGIAVGLARFERGAQRIPEIVGGFAFAMAIHVAFNNLVTRISSGPLLIYAGIAGFGTTGLIIYAIKRGLAEEKEWIEETLGEADRVTASEKEAVMHLGDMQQHLGPLAERFGLEKSLECERFLVLQARLGIMRKTVEKHTDEAMKQAVLAQMDEVRAEMDEARRAVGTYAMLYLRNIFPPDASPLWGFLENALDERVAESGIVPEELLNGLQPDQRTLMEIILEKPDGVSHEVLRASVSALDNQLSDDHFSVALNQLIQQGFVTKFGEERISYRAKRSEAGKVVTQGSWGLDERLGGR